MQIVPALCISAMKTLFDAAIDGAGRFANEYGNQREACIQCGAATCRELEACVRV
jgi:hypothetical protein